MRQEANAFANTHAALQKEQAENLHSQINEISSAVNEHKQHMAQLKQQAHVIATEAAGFSRQISEGRQSMSNVTEEIRNIRQKLANADLSVNNILTKAESFGNIQEALSKTAMEMQGIIRQIAESAQDISREKEGLREDKVGLDNAVRHLQTCAENLERMIKEINVNNVPQNNVPTTLPEQEQTPEQR